MLFKASWAMLKDDRSLLMFPLISGIAVVVLMVLVGLPLALAGAFDGGGDTGTAMAVVALFIIYFVVYTAIIFCNAAMVSVVMDRMSGDSTVTAGDGWAAARSRLPMILGYAAISATVGVILNLVAERFEGLGRFLAALGGAAWGIATFLVVPVLVVEDIGPVDAVKRSSSLLTRTWGEQVIGNAGIGLVTGLLTFAIVAIGAGLIALAASIGGAVVIGLVVVVVAIAIGLTLVVSGALDTIYRTAVYRYATQQPIADYAAADELPLAFQARDIVIGDRHPRRQGESGTRSTLRIRNRS
jgi:hypothetical protein